MSQELHYTSAPRGLKPGSRGFCTVATTPGMSGLLAERLEALSGYRQVFPPHDPSVGLNPVVLSHLRLNLSGKPYHVLSRIGFAGLDYTERSNKYAHHIVPEPGELPLGGPAWLLGQPGFLEKSWTGEPGIIPSGRHLPQGDRAPGIAQTWLDRVGDAGWAGVLAESFLADPRRPVHLIFEPGMDLLPLLEEAFALLPPSRRWDVTFSTYFTTLPQGTTCDWRCVLRDSPEAQQVSRLPDHLILDLCVPLGHAEGGVLVDQARTGDLLEVNFGRVSPPKFVLPQTPLHTMPKGRAVIPIVAVPPELSRTDSLDNIQNSDGIRLPSRRSLSKVKKYRLVLVTVASLFLIGFSTVAMIAWLKTKPVKSSDRVADIKLPPSNMGAQAINDTHKKGQGEAVPEIAKSEHLDGNSKATKENPHEEIQIIGDPMNLIAGKNPHEKTPVDGNPPGVPTPPSPMLVESAKVDDIGPPVQIPKQDELKNTDEVFYKKLEWPTFNQVGPRQGTEIIPCPIMEPDGCKIQLLGLNDPQIQNPRHYKGINKTNSTITIKYCPNGDNGGALGNEEEVVTFSVAADGVRVKWPKDEPSLWEEHTKILSECVLRIVQPNGKKISFILRDLLISKDPVFLREGMQNLSWEMTADLSVNAGVPPRGPVMFALRPIHLRVCEFDPALKVESSKEPEIVVIKFKDENNIVITLKLIQGASKIAVLVKPNLAETKKHRGNAQNDAKDAQTKLDMGKKKPKALQEKLKKANDLIDSSNEIENVIRKFEEMKISCRLSIIVNDEFIDIARIGPP